MWSAWGQKKEKHVLVSRNGYVQLKLMSCWGLDRKMQPEQAVATQGWVINYIRTKPGEKARPTITTAVINVHLGKQKEKETKLTLAGKVPLKILKVWIYVRIFIETTIKWKGNESGEGFKVCGAQWNFRPQPPSPWSPQTLTVKAPLPPPPPHYISINWVQVMIS